MGTFVQPIFEKIPQGSSEGFRVKIIRSNSFGCRWHFHPEYELTLTLRGHGHRIVGDNLGEFKPGDLVLVGANVPHDWQADASDSAPAIHAIVVHFRENLLGPQLPAMTAFEPVRKLLERSHLGLHVAGKTAADVAALMKRLTFENGLKRVIDFLVILDRLATSDDCTSLCSTFFKPTLNHFDERRVGRICRYINENLDRQTYVREAAALVNLSEGAFSRYFKSRTGRTFPAFVNQLRIGRVCRLLSCTSRPITEIAFECGFQNLSNFNRQFLKSKHVSPREYRRRFDS